jgi:hypothetical protein
MNASEAAGSQRRKSRDLPPYWAVMVVDARGFSKLPGAAQSRLNAEIQDVLPAAFARAGLTPLWTQRRFAAHTGDGYVLVNPAAALPHLLHPLLPELQAELADRDHRRLARDPRLRLRASVHVGPLPDAGRLGDGVGAPMTETHRLLDSAEVRQVLERADEEATFLAAIVSQRAYLDAIASGYTALLPSEFRQVVAVSKNYEERAYLYVPRPSGRLLGTGDERATEVPRPETRSADGAGDRIVEIGREARIVNVGEVSLGDGRR